MDGEDSADERPEAAPEDEREAGAEVPLQSALEVAPEGEPEVAAQAPPAPPAPVQEAPPAAMREEFHYAREPEKKKPVHKLVNWRTTITLDHGKGKTSVPAQIRDISMNDVYIECEWNFLEKIPLQIVFSLPPQDAWSPPETVRITARILSDVLSHDKFCYVLQIVEFHGKSREILSRFFAAHADSVLHAEG